MTDAKPSRAELGESAFKAWGGRKPRALLHGGFSHRDLVVRDGYLYVSEEDSGEISRLPVGGGVPLVLAQVHRPGAMVLANGSLYAITHDPERNHNHHQGSGRIVRMPLEGGEPEVLVKDLVNPLTFAVDGHRIVVACDGPFDYDKREEPRGSIVLVDGDQKPTTLARRLRRPHEIAFVGDEIYWIEMGMKHPTYFGDGALRRMRPARGEKRWCVRKNLPMPGGLLVDGDHVYFSTSTTYGSAAPGAVFARPRPVGKPEEIAWTFDMEGVLMAMDDTHLYRLSSSGGVLRRFLKRDDDGEGEQLFESTERPTLVSALTLDAENIYWAVTNAPGVGGAVWSMRKDIVSRGPLETKVVN